jgi:tRNA-5-methyluridine54 2-sulfurtransferase
MDDAAFIRRFEERVRRTVEDYGLLAKCDRVLVAVSGGKDSTTALHLLGKMGYDVEALIIDQLLGEHTRRNLGNIRAFCDEVGVRLHVVHMRDEYGCSVCYMKSVLDGKGIRMNSCTICGVIRRNILNRKARELGATKLATGHNLDDEAQTMFMNFVRGDFACLARAGPKTGIREDRAFVQRVKPLFFCLESDVKRYSQLHGFPVQYEPCPCSLESYRTEVKGYLDGMEAEVPGSKLRMVEGFLETVPQLRGRFGGSVNACRKCGEPSSGDLCRTCALMGMLAEPQSKKPPQPVSRCI